MSGWQIFQGHIELFVLGYVPMIPREITHRTTQVGVNSVDRILAVRTQLSHMAACCYDEHTGDGSQAPLLGSPVVLLLYDGGQFLVEDLQVGEAHLQGVSLRANELLGLPDVLHLPVPGLKPAFIISLL